MEWVLQLFDELDDALAVLAHWSVGSIPWSPPARARRALHSASGLRSFRGSDEPVDSAAGRV